MSQEIVTEMAFASEGSDTRQSGPQSDTMRISAMALTRAVAVGEHAAFLWETRKAVVRSCIVTFDALTRYDERLWRLLLPLSARPAIAEPLLERAEGPFKSGILFVAAVVALRGGTMAVSERLFARLDSDPAVLSPLSSALAWLEWHEVRSTLGRLGMSGSPAVATLGMIAAVAHRQHPGAALEYALDSEVPALRACAFETIGRLSLQDRQPALKPALEHPDDECRFSAAWSLARLGDRAAIPVLGSFAATSGPFAVPACEIALRVLDLDQAIRAHRRLASKPGNETLAVKSAGIIGDPRLGEWLLDAMQTPALARAAASAFCLMTGCDLRRNDLDTAPRSDSAGPQGDLPDEARARAEYYDDAPWPEPDRVRDWWARAAPRFAAGTRYLAGLPLTPNAAQAVLRTGNQVQRAAASLELGVGVPDVPMLDVTAPAHRQL